MNYLPLFKNRKEYLTFFLFLTLILLFNLLYQYKEFSEFKNSLLYTTKAQVINKYGKDDYDIYKFETDNFSFFSSINKDLNLKKLDLVEISIITKDIDFISYLKNFYAKTFNIFLIESDSIKKSLANNISSQHINNDLAEIYQAIFLAIPTNSSLRDVFAIYSISHLIAISGFHLAVLSFILYVIFYYPYNIFHNRYFPFRNKKFDILLISFSFLFIYLIFTNLVPSLLRAFIMMCMGLFLLRSNIKIVSFETLLFTLLFIVVLFPKYTFSLSMWFSIIGVFYIFLFIKYFKGGNKIMLALFFNFWIFASFNPIVHYFFGVTSYIQLFSPIITLFFTIFYPLELFLHFIGYGDLLDSFLEFAIGLEFKTYEVLTPLWFFIIYIFVSLVSTINKYLFYLLNLLLLFFNFYLYHKIFYL